MTKIVKRRKTRRLGNMVQEEKIQKVGRVKHLNVDFDQDMSSGVWDQEIKAFMEATTLKGLFFSEDWVFMILDLIAESVAASPMVVDKVVAEKNGKKIVEEMDEHPALTLLRNPNEFQEYSTFIYNYVVELDLMGNSLVHYNANRQKLHIIPTESMNLKLDEEGKLVGYEIFNDVSAMEMLPGNGLFFLKKSIWHQKRPNPKSALYGLSPFIPTRKNVLFNRYTSNWLNSFYLKGATPTVSLSMDRNVDEKSALRFLRSFENAYTGVRNMRRPLVLPKGVTAETMSPSVADQQLIELINKNRENIINILRVPKHALSLAESGSLGSEEHKQSLRYFYTASIVPTQRKIAEHFTRNMRNTGLLDESESLRFDNKEVEPLRDDLAKKAELSASLLSIMTPNEIRLDLWDKEPIEGGDTLQSAPSPLSQPFGFSLPRQSQPEPEEPEEPETKALIDDDDLKPQSKEYRDAVNKAVFSKYDKHIEIKEKQVTEVVEGPGQEVAKLWREILEKWNKDAIKAVKAELRKAPAQKTKAEDDEAATKIPSKRRLRKQLQSLFGKQSSEWIKFVEDNLSTVVADSFDLQVAPIADGDNIVSIAAIRDRDADSNRTILAARAGQAFKDISDSQVERIMRQVEQGIANKTPLDKLGREIDEKHKNISAARAETIARTEALTAVSIGQQAAQKAAVEVIGEENLVKVWINLGDSRVRGNPDGLYPSSKADHWDLQSETRELDEPFSNGLMYPRDLDSGEASEVINCRCTNLLVPKEDFDSLDI